MAHTDYIKGGAKGKNISFFVAFYLQTLINVCICTMYAYMLSTYMCAYAQGFILCAYVCISYAHAHTEKDWQTISDQYT